MSELCFTDNAFGLTNVAGPKQHSRILEQWKRRLLTRYGLHFSPSLEPENGHHANTWLDNPSVQLIQDSHHKLFHVLQRMLAES